LSVAGIDRRVLVLALARMTDSLGNSFLIVVLPLYVKSGLVTGGTFGIAVPLMTGLILSMFGFLNSFVQPFTGRFSDRTGRRKLFVLLGLAILAVTNFAYSYATSYDTMLLVRAVQGLGVAFTIPATVALVNEYATTANRGANMGAFNTLRLLGFGVGPVVAGTVVAKGPYSLSLAGTSLQLTGFEAAFYVASLSAVASFLLVSLFVFDPEEVEAQAGKKLKVAVLSDDEHTLDPVFTLGLASLFMAIGIALIATIEPAVNTRLHQTSVMFGVEFGAFVAAQILTQAPIGKATDRYGRLPFIQFGLLLLVPSIFAQGLVTTPWGMVGARFVQGLAASMVFAPALALAGDLTRKGESGTQLSVLTMSFGLGTAIGPLASGFLISFGFIFPFIFGTVLAAVGAVLVFTQVEETVRPGGRDAPTGKPATQD